MAENRTHSSPASDGTEARREDAKRASRRRPVENSIQPAPARDRASPPARLPTSSRVADEESARRFAAEGVRTKDISAPAVAAPALPPANAWVVPERVAERFVRVKNAYFYPNGSPAFEDHGRKLTTKSENTELVRSLVEIAQARGWDEITVSGSNRFRQKAWQVATLAGVAVRGYAPTDVEQAQVVRALARRRASAAPTATAANAERVAEPSPQVPAAAPSARTPAARPRQAPPRAERPPQPNEPSRTRSRLDEAPIVGEFVGYGPANYKFQKDEDPSFYVKLRVRDSRDGSLRERYVWGRDLERAIEESVTRPQFGELIGLRRTGQKAVSITVPEYDQAGQLIGERERLVNRYTWAVEKINYFTERATTSRVLREAHQDARRAARDNPELAATMLTLRAADLATAERLRNADDRRDFIKQVAEQIGQRAERGEALPRARLRERAQASQEPQERDPNRDPPVRG